jgi:hypothetical protein
MGGGNSHQRRLFRRAMEHLLRKNMANTPKQDKQAKLYFWIGLCVALGASGLPLIGITVNIRFGGIILAGAFVCLVVAFWIWEAPFKMHVYMRGATVIFAGILYFGWVGNQMLTEFHKKKPVALQVTGYTVYQQTVGTPLRIGVHTFNDSDETLLISLANSIGVLESTKKESPELEEKIFHSAQEEFDKGRKSGALAKNEIPAKSKMHFDVDTSPKLLTDEILKKIDKDSISAYWAVVIVYTDKTGEQFVPFCAFTDASTKSVLNCRQHNAPFHKP